MSLASSGPLDCDEILITAGDQPKAVEADSRHLALAFIRLSGVRARRTRETDSNRGASNWPSRRGKLAFPRSKMSPRRSRNSLTGTRRARSPAR